jgi:hypothetical protein
LRTFEAVVELIGHTRTVTGLRVQAKLDKRRYRTGVIVSRAEMKQLELHRHTFHGRRDVRVVEGARLEIALAVCDGVLQISITVADPET